MHKRDMVGLLTIVAIAGSVSAAGPGDWLRRDNLGKLTASFDADFRAYCDREATHVGPLHGEIGWRRYRATGTMPVVQGADKYDVSVVGRFKGLFFDRGDLRLPDTRERFPRNLYDVGLGMVGRTALPVGMLGLHVDVGSPSDRPFASHDETAITASLFWRVPHGEQTAWLFLLNYSNVREFCEHVPLPGAAFLYEPDRTLNVMAGMPMSRARWQPTGRLTLEASWMMIRDIHAKASYEIIKNVSLYAAFDWDNERFLRHDREDDDHRLFYYEKRVTGGVRWQITKHIFADAFVGYAFDRFWFEDDDYDGRDHNRLNVDDGPVAGVQVGVRW